MEPTTLEQVAAAVAWLGALGVLTAALNVFALHVVRADDVPAWLQARVRWWNAHNPAFLVASVLVTVVSLAVLAATTVR